ncbi:MAG TPA: Gfo/Idh/MocA family oxidoreductase [Candidatus Limnocylindrales bacterium]
MAARIGIGLVGAGRMGSTHARILARGMPEAALAGIADVDLAAARRLADEVGVEIAVGSVEELLAAPGVDALLVAVSTHQHVAVVEAAAAAGRDVLCEKPLALTLADTDRAIAAAGRAGIRLQVGFMRRWDADYRRAHERVTAGAIGRAALFKSLQYDTELPPLAFCDPAVSGGIMVDMGIHEFDLARWLTGDEVVEVHAYGSCLVHPELAAVGDVDNAVVDLRFAGGAVGSVELSRDAVYGEDVRTEVLGTAGSVFVGLLPNAPSVLGTPGRLEADTVPSSMTRFAPAFAEQVRGFARAILDDRPVAVDGRDSRAALAIALAADASWREGRPVRVG